MQGPVCVSSIEYEEEIELTNEKITEADNTYVHAQFYPL